MKHHSTLLGNPPPAAAQHRCAAVLLLVACAAFGARAGSVDPVPPPLTLDACLRIALDANPRLEAAAQAGAAARAAAGVARAPYYPSVGVRAGVSRWQTHAFLPNGLGAPQLPSVIGPTDDWSAGAYARYLLYDGGARRAGLAAARAAAEVQGSDAAATRQDVVLGVRTAFYALAAAADLHAVAVRALTNAQAHVVLARRRQAAGAVTEADVLRAQVEADDAAAGRVRAEGELRIAAGALNAAMGLAAEQPIDIAPDAGPGPATEAGSLTNLIARALADRTELRAARSRVAAARQRRRAASSAYGPHLYADGSYGRRDDRAAMDDEAWAAGVTAEWTLFEGFATRQEVARRTAEQAGAEAELALAELAVRQEVWTAAARVREARELVTATATQVRDAQESVRLMAARYEAGAATMSDLLDAQTACTAAEGRHVQARWTHRHAAAVLDRAAGRLDATLPTAHGQLPTADR